MQVFWTPGVTLDQLEKMAVKAALQHYDGHIGQTAHSLGISEKTLYNLRERYVKEDTITEDAAEKDRLRRVELLKEQGYRGELPDNLKPAEAAQGAIASVDKYRSLQEEFDVANDPDSIEVNPPFERFRVVSDDEESLEPVGLPEKSEEERKSRKKNAAAQS